MTTPIQYFIMLMLIYGVFTTTGVYVFILYEIIQKNNKKPTIIDIVKNKVLYIVNNNNDLYLFLMTLISLFYLFFLAYIIGILYILMELVVLPMNLIDCMFSKQSQHQTEMQQIDTTL